MTPSPPLTVIAAVMLPHCNYTFALWPTLQSHYSQPFLPITACVSSVEIIASPPSWCFIQFASNLLLSSWFLVYLFPSTSSRRLLSCYGGFFFVFSFTCSSLLLYCLCSLFSSYRRQYSVQNLYVNSSIFVLEKLIFTRYPRQKSWIIRKSFWPSNSSRLKASRFVWCFAEAAASCFCQVRYLTAIRSEVFRRAGWLLQSLISLAVVVA